MVLVSEQSIYDLLTRTVELEVIPACLGYGLAFLPYSPLGGGMLGGKSADNEKARRAFLSQSEAITAFQKYCRSLGRTASEVALAWLAQRPGVTAPIIGPPTMAQFYASVAALELKLDDDVLQRVDELFPAPGGAAPEAYA
jgi:NDP-hexose C3-ketoreductase / dTDP-4-oxo-2-deoxy-alpha-D-pentos-2-ene 2,3-reductase